MSTSIFNTMRKLLVLNEILLLKSAEKYNEKNTNKIEIDTLNKSINISEINYELIIKYDSSFPIKLDEARISIKSK
jgi:hypothetical protein